MTLPKLAIEIVKLHIKSQLFAITIMQYDATGQTIQ